MGVRRAFVRGWACWFRLAGKVSWVLVLGRALIVGACLDSDLRDGVSRR